MIATLREKETTVTQYYIVMGYWFGEPHNPKPFTGTLVEALPEALKCGGDVFLRGACVWENPGCIGLYED